MRNLLLRWTAARQPSNTSSSTPACTARPPWRAQRPAARLPSAPPPAAPAPPAVAPAHHRYCALTDRASLSLSYSAACRCACCCACLVRQPWSCHQHCNPGHGVSSPNRLHRNAYPTQPMMQRLLGLLGLGLGFEWHACVARSDALALAASRCSAAFCGSPVSCSLEVAALRTAHCARLAPLAPGSSTLLRVSASHPETFEGHTPACVMARTHSSCHPAPSVSSNHISVTPMHSMGRRSAKRSQQR